MIPFVFIVSNMPSDSARSRVSEGAKRIENLPLSFSDARQTSVIN